MVLKDIREIDRVISWWQTQLKIQRYDLKSFLTVRHETDVGYHLMRLASGLDSMILGEPQILGQIKRSYAMARKARTVGGILNRLFQKVFSVAKQVRCKTGIGQCPISMACSALSLAKQNIVTFSGKKILVVGAGETASLVIRHLSDLNPESIFVVNRTLSKAKILAQSEDFIFAHPLDLLPELVKEADIIVTAINSRKILISKEMLSNKRLPSIVIDLSLPQVVSEDLNQLPQVIQYCFDDVDNIIKNNQSLRKKASIIADKWIEKGLNEYISREKSLRSDNLIIAIRQYSRKIVDDELQRSLKRLEKGKEPQVVLTRFAHSISNKWMHVPTICIRNATIKGREDLLEQAREIFGLEMEKK
jgi:glutamyl-tRNA reductase